MEFENVVLTAADVDHTAFNEQFEKHPFGKYQMRAVVVVCLYLHKIHNVQGNILFTRESCSFEIETTCVYIRTSTYMSNYWIVQDEPRSPMTPDAAS